MNAPFYGELLIKEGRKEEAEIFLNAWKRIMTHLAHSDARGLNESRMMANMSYTGRENSNLYERLGDLDKAAKARAEYEALWASIYGSTRDRTLDFPEKQTHLRWALLARCGVDAVSLQTMTMKNVQFADFFDAEAMECSRHQEYLLADSLMIGVISILIMVTMLGCLVVTLWFRFWRKSAPLLLLPSLMETMCISLGGVLLPLLVYQLLVRLLPCAGRGYGIFYVWPKYLAGVICLLVAMGWLTATLSAYFLRRRCRQLGVATPIKSHWGWLAAAGSLLVLQIVFFCIPESEIQTVLDPSRWPLLPAVALLALTLFKILFAIPVPPGKHWGWLAAIAMIIGPFSLFYVNHATCNAEQLLLALSVLLGLLALLWLFFVFRRRRQPPVILPFYRGTLVRSLVPVLALSMLFLNLVSAPWYRFEELRLMEQKNAILISPENGCSVFQNRCVEKWNAELQAALEKLGK
jgi:hypothetical protein